MMATPPGVTRPYVNSLIEPVANFTLFDGPAFAK